LGFLGKSRTGQVQVGNLAPTAVDARSHLCQGCSRALIPLQGTKGRGIGSQVQVGNLAPAAETIAAPFDFDSHYDFD